MSLCRVGFVQDFVQSPSKLKRKAHAPWSPTVWQQYGERPGTDRHSISTVERMYLVLECTMRQMILQWSSLTP